MYIHWYAEQTTVNFDGSERHCKELGTLLQLQTPGIFQQNIKLSDALYTDGTMSGFTPLILLPGVKECCGKKVVIR